MNESYKGALAPILECEISLSQQRMALHKMFALAMANIPDNETDNFTARELLPAYLAFCQTMENIEKLE